MNDFIQYAYSWHTSSVITFLVAGVGCGLLLSISRKRKLMIVLFCALLWTIGIYPVSVISNYNRWQQNVESCMEHSDYHMRGGICYRPVDGYVPVSTWVIPGDMKTTNYSLK